MNTYFPKEVQPMTEQEKSKILATMGQEVYDICVDSENIGTKDYKGLSSFGWNREYSYPLWDISRERRRELHNAWVGEGLDLGGVSPTHDAFIYWQEILMKGDIAKQNGYSD